VRLNRPVSGHRRSRKSAFFAIAVLLLTGIVVLRLGNREQSAGQRSADAAASFASPLGPAVPVGRAVGRHDLLAHLGAAPISFEANEGQTDARVKFLARGSGYGLFLTADEAVLALSSPTSDKKKGNPQVNSVIRMKLAGASKSATVTGTDQLAGKSNYLVGNDPSKWRSNVAHFARVRYASVYPGVDLVYYGNQSSLEYDFEIAPGADPKPVQLKFEGTEKVELDTGGNLILETAGGNVQLHAPKVYQRVGSERRPVAAKFDLLADNRVGFALGDYDRSRAIVIDPVLTYSSFLGGSGNETSPSIAVDSGFNIYIAGQTASTNFPLVAPTPTPPPFQPTLKAPSDVFVTKLDPTGSTLVFSTYLGGTGDDFPAGIAVDAGSDVFVAGTTNAGDFPIVGGFQTTPPAGGNHVFVSELKPDGSGLLYSTYLAGSGTDVAAGLAVDNRSNAYVIGTTTSANFPVTSGTFQGTLQADNAFFVSKITPTVTGASSLPFSTYFGGGNPATGAIASGGGIAVDTNGLIYITGGTNLLHVGNTGTAATDFPILDAAQPCLNLPAVAPTTPPTPPSPCSTTVTATTDAFVAKLNPAAGTGAQVVYSTYLGGSGSDVGNGIAVDTGGNVYVTGSTTSTDEFVPAGTTPFQLNNAGGGDAFVAKLNNPAAGTPIAITYFSYLGGTGADSGSAIVVDNTQTVRVTGTTASANLPVTSGAPQGALGGGTDAFLGRIDTTASATLSPNNLLTYLGGSGVDRGTGVALDTSFQTYVTGDTTSSNFPVRGTAFQGGPQGGSDAFITKLGGVSDLQVTVAATINPIGVGNQDTFKYTIKNAGPDPTSGVTFSATVPSSGATIGTTSSSPGSCATAVGNTVQCLIGTLANAGTATVTVLLTPTTSAQSLTSSGTVGVTPSINPPSSDPVASNNSASTSVPVTDFSVSASPSTNTVVAGNTATYQVTVSPLPTYTNSIALSCSAGLPTTGARCDFSTASVTITNSSPVSSTLTISTTARPVPTTALRRTGEVLFAAILPVGGFTLLGLGFGGMSRRKKRFVMGLMLVVLLSMIGLQLACGGSSSKPPITGGTAAGTYTVTITGTSGSASHGTAVTLVVQ